MPPPRYPHAAVKRDERGHGVVLHAIELGYTDTGDKYYVRGCDDHEMANQVRLTINRALKHFGLTPSSWVVDSADKQCYKNCQDEKATHGVGFELHTKDAARRYILEKAKAAPSKVKYNPYSRKKTQKFSDDGTWNP
jgi:hypothetical protein